MTTTLQNVDHHNTPIALKHFRPPDKLSNHSGEGCSEIQNVHEADQVKSQPRSIFRVEENRRLNLTLLSACCFIITFVGIVDTWLVVKYSDSIFDMEKNPICLFLLQQDPYGLMVFVYSKVAGLVLVIGSLVALFRYWEKNAVLIACAVTLFQLSLLGYLFVLSDIPHFVHVHLGI